MMQMKQAGPKMTQSVKFRNNLFLTIRFVLLCILAVSMLFPLVWMITLSLKSSDTIFMVPPDFLPKEFHFENYITAIEKMDFFRAFGNTMFVTVVATVGQLFSCTLVGYAISRLKFPGRKIWFYSIVASMMLPGMIGVIPVFMVFSKLKWIDTFWPLIIPPFLGAPFATFLLRQNFLSIPKSFDEAARIDGANHFTILFRILMPMVKPAMMVILIGAVQGSWNDYLNPLLYLHKKELWTLSISIKQFISSYAISWNYFMAAEFLYILPIIVLFLLLQKYFMQGLGSLNSAALK